MKRWINQHPTRWNRAVLGLVPFLALLVIYVLASQARLAENPNDPLLPSLDMMASAVDRLAFQADPRSGNYLFWTDTAASLQRIGLGILVSASIGLFFGMLNGSLPIVRAKLSPVITAISLVPPMAILPVLFILFGLGELSKVMLIVIGTAPFIIRDLQQRTLSVPSEQLIKAQTLGGNSWQVMIRVLLPQVMPRLLSAMRLSLGTAWLFLIAAEAIAATDGLGYRIFLVRRYLSMDVILPYVAWITFLAFLLDYTLNRISRTLFPWFHDTEQRGGES